jgi:hypothetical protein
LGVWVVISRRGIILLVSIGTVLLVSGGIWLHLASDRPRAIDAKPREPDPALLTEALVGSDCVESGIEGHRDFRFENPEGQPLSVAVEVKNCQCAGIEFGQLPEECRQLELAQLRQRVRELSISWEKLEPGGAKLTIGPRAVGLVRMRWKSATVGDHLLWANLSLENGERQGSLRLEVPLHFVEPVRVRLARDPRKAEGDIGKLGPGEEHTIEFLCFSFTREQFNLSKPANGDTCFEQCSPQTMSKEELTTLAEKVGRAVLAGYRSAVTVREHAGENQLDLGPFHRNIVWQSDVASGHEASTFVNGKVLGEVRLAGVKKKPYLDLGNVIPANPTPLDFTLESDISGLQLTLDESKTLEFLNVELLDGPEGKPVGDGTNWRVRAAFKTDSPFRGKFPVRERPGYDTDVACSIVFVLTHKGQANKKPRRLLIPVHGNVPALGESR